MSILMTHGAGDAPHSAPVGPATEETPGPSAQARGSWHRAVLFEGRRGKASA